MTAYIFLTLSINTRSASKVKRITCSQVGMWCHQTPSSENPKKKSNRVYGLCYQGDTDLLYWLVLKGKMNSVNVAVTMRPMVVIPIEVEVKNIKKLDPFHKKTVHQSQTNAKVKLLHWENCYSGVFMQKLYLFSTGKKYYNELRNMYPNMDSSCSKLILDWFQ